jgi:alpha-beta hydrolase superfamily lysophospholipase
MNERYSLSLSLFMFINSSSCYSSCYSSCFSFWCSSCSFSSPSSSSSTSDMEYCRAFYKQQKYATVDDANKMKKNALVMHGIDDKVLCVAAGEHLNDSLPSSTIVLLPGTSHQVMEEQPEKVASAMLDFIFNQK